MFYIRTADRLQRTSTWLRQPRRRPRLRAQGGLRRLAGHRRRARSRHAARGRHLRLRVEERGRDDPETLQALPPLREQRRARPSVVFVEERGQIRSRPARRAPERHSKVCRLRDDILPDTGVCALVERRAGRRFSNCTSGTSMRSDNRDPFVRRQRALARPRRQPRRRAGRRLADLQASLRPAHRRMPRSARTRCSLSRCDRARPSSWRGRIQNS